MKQLTLFDPIEVPLIYGFVTLIDVADADLVSFKWSIKRHKNKMPYVVRHDYSSGVLIDIMLHRVILSRVLGRLLLSKEIVDHIDTNKLNNRRDNLRLATPAENSRNLPHKQNPLRIQGM